MYFILYFVLYFAYAAVYNLCMEKASLGRVTNRGSVCLFRAVLRNYCLSVSFPFTLFTGYGGECIRRRSEQTSYKRKYIKLYQLNWGHDVNGNLSNRGIVRITNR